MDGASHGAGPAFVLPRCSASTSSLLLFCSGNNLYEPSDSTFFFLLFPLMYCVCYLFLSYTDRTMQCEIAIQ